MSLIETLSTLLSPLATCLPCLPSTPSVRLHDRTFRLLRLLGEGASAYIYLVSDESGSLHALKRISLPFGAESLARATAEVNAYRAFGHVTGIIELEDHEIREDEVLLLLPFYNRGSLQDAINANLVNGTTFPEPKLMELFLAICRAVAAMHAGGRGDTGGERDGLLTGPVGEGGSYAHRDIKPANIMVSDNGQPILMDLGSAGAIPLKITTPSAALAAQDAAAEECTMTYRAPELFDVQAGMTLDGKVDVWSLGCLLYACIVGKSPFEARADETGGSLAMCVMGLDWRFPEGKGSDGVRRVVSACLKESEDRVDIAGLITLVEEVLEDMEV